VKLREQAQLRAGAGLDLERIAAIAGASMPRYRPVTATSDTPARPRPRARLALARDAAFCFYYEENLRLLAEAGFELVPFRPTQDSALPEDVDAVYLGGGYPESFATELAVVARGQEFHQSRIVRCEPMPTLFELTAGPARREGFLRGSLAASYVHLHFASCPELTTNLATNALAARRGRG
jgi:cobyrinic acid a,c-diamide synthase